MLMMQRGWMSILGAANQECMTPFGCERNSERNAASSDGERCQCEGNEGRGHAQNFEANAWFQARGNISRNTGCCSRSQMHLCSKIPQRTQSDWGHVKQYTRSHRLHFRTNKRTIEPAFDTVLDENTSGRLENKQGGIGKVLQPVQNLRMPWKNARLICVFQRLNHKFFHRAVTSLSPAKKGRHSIFFDEITADATSKIRLVGFDAAQQKNFRITNRKKLQLKSWIVKLSHPDMVMGMN